MTVVTRTDLNWWLKREPELDWRFATTYAERAPHEYVVADKTPGLTQDDVARAAHVIRTHGEPMKFHKETRIYLVTPMGWKHWDMQGALIDDPSVTLINRGRVEHVYGVQNMPRTASDMRSAYDEIATTWDRDHGMNENEIHVLTQLIQETCRATLGRTLDVGCGTGIPLDLNLVESVRYVGIDPSTAMLNALVMKHPLLAGVHPMTYADAERRQVLCGTRFDSVFALGGSASYLAPDEIKQLCSRSTRSVILMHYLPGVLPATHDLDPEVAEESLRTASASATLQMRVGRFIVSALPGNAAVLS